MDVQKINILIIVLEKSNGFAGISVTKRQWIAWNTNSAVFGDVDCNAALSASVARQGTCWSHGWLVVIALPVA